MNLIIYVNFYSFGVILFFLYNFKKWDSKLLKQNLYYFYWYQYILWGYYVVTSYFKFNEIINYLNIPIISFLYYKLHMMIKKKNDTLSLKMNPLISVIYFISLIVISLLFFKNIPSTMKVIILIFLQVFYLLGNIEKL